MCGRITLREPRRVIAAILGRDIPNPELLPPARYNIGPGEDQLAIRRAAAAEEKRELCRIFWGFVPRWKKEQNAPPIINARSETAATKPSFREAFRHRRCVIPADGFYEWKRQGRERQPWFFTLKDEVPFALAAICGDAPKSRKAIASDGFCLLTTASNSLMAPIHDRMPVLLDESGVRRWLEAGPDEDLRDLLTPFPSNRMKARPVSPWVNKIGNEGPRCIEPFAGPENGEEQLALF